MELLVLLHSDKDVDREVVGAHLHTGRTAVNGLININLVRLPPLPPPALLGVSNCPSASDSSNPRQTDLEHGKRCYRGVRRDHASGRRRHVVPPARAPLTRSNLPYLRFTRIPGAWGVARGGQLSPVPCDRFGLASEPLGNCRLCRPKRARPNAPRSHLEAVRNS
jgi:hypothetical protein